MGVTPLLAKVDAVISFFEDVQQVAEVHGNGVEIYPSQFKMFNTRITGGWPPNISEVAQMIKKQTGVKPDKFEVHIIDDVNEMRYYFDKGVVLVMGACLKFTFSTGAVMDPSDHPIINKMPLMPYLIVNRAKRRKTRIRRNSGRTLFIIVNP